MTASFDRIRKQSYDLEGVILMSPEAIKKRIERAVSEMSSNQLAEILKFIETLQRPRRSPSRGSARQRFWDLAGVGSSGLGDIGRHKHHYLADAYESDSNS